MLLAWDIISDISGPIWFSRCVLILSDPQHFLGLSEVMIVKLLRDHLEICKHFLYLILHVGNLHNPSDFILRFSNALHRFSFLIFIYCLSVSLSVRSFVCSFTSPFFLSFFLSLFISCLLLAFLLFLLSFWPSDLHCL